MAWYRTGTVSVTNNSTTVVGVGTAWVQAASVGETFLGPDSNVYEITAISSNTSLNISPAYKSGTSTAQNYAIMPTQGYLRDLAAQAAALVASYAAVRDGAGAGKFAAGTEAAPSLRGAADENTGVRFAGNDVLQLITNGASRLQLAADGTPTGVTADKLRDRTTHTGAQEISTVTGLQTALDTKAPVSHTHDAADIASGVLADSRLPARLRAVPQVVTDWNTAVSSGWYQGNGAANAPSTGNFLGNVECHHERWVTQVVHAFNTDSASDTKTFRRECSDASGTAVWGPWYRLRLSEAEQATLRQTWWDSTAVPMNKVTNLQTTLDSLAAASVAQTNVGPAHNELPSNQHLGALAFLDTLGATQVAQHVRDSRPGDVWHEWVSNTQLIKKFHGFDGVIRTITETYA